MSELRLKKLRVVNSSLLAWIKQSLILPDDIRIVRVATGPREDEFTILLESKEFEETPRDANKYIDVPYLKPEFKKP